MGVCSINIPKGINDSCLIFEAPIKNIIITSPTESFASTTLFKNIASWKTKIQTLLAYIPDSLASYENTTEDPTINTTTFGQKVQVRAGVPSMKVMLQSNTCDFAELLSTLKGGIYGIWFILENGAIKAQYNSDGTITGFKARVNATTKGVPIPDAVENSYPVTFNFIDYEEFVQTITEVMAWNPARELPAAMPDGLSMRITTVYSNASGEVKVHVAERCGANKTGLLLADWLIDSTNDLTSPDVTGMVEDGLGVYTLTIEKEVVPESLAVGDYAVVYVKVLSGAIVTDVGGLVYIEAFA